MKTLLLFLSLWTGMLQNQQDNILVYIFMGEECVISQNYTLTLKQLHEQYADESLSFVGVFPNRYSTSETMATFQEKYQLPFELMMDKAQVIMRKYDVKVTPEVVVINIDQQQIIYQGRIDNTYFRVGKRRSVTTTADLETALKSLKNGETVTTAKTQAIGCFITPVDPNFKDLPLCEPKKIGNNK